MAENQDNRGPSRFNSFERLVFIGIASLALVLSLVAIHGVRVGLMPSLKGEQPVQTAPTVRADFSYAAQRVIPALVKIENLSLTSHPGTGPFGGGEVAETREGAGFFIDKDGLVLTNYHVVEDAEDLRVVTTAHKSYKAEVVGADPVTDLALVRITPDFDVKPAELGDSSRVKVGQWVLALGNPLGLEFFTSAGIVSGFGPPGRGYPGIYDFIQIDVNIKPGNSGGPLVDYDGKVVGINNAYLGPGTGIGFSIPINRAKSVIPELLKTGRVSRGFMGLLGQPVTEGLKERFGLDTLQGALVNAIMPGGPADRAGIREGDVVVGYDGKPVTDDRGLRKAIFSSPANAEVALDVVRDGKRKTVRVKLGELSAHDVLNERVVRQCGVTLQEIDEGMAAKLGRKSPGGLLVLKVIPGCPAQEAGLRFGDIIEEVEGKTVYNLSGFYRDFSAAKPGSQVLLKITRRGMPQFITIKQGAEG